MKTQLVRLLDVVILGPVMVYGGARLARRRKDAVLGAFIAAAGVGTMLYNWRNYQIERRRLTERDINQLDADLEGL